MTNGVQRAQERSKRSIDGEDTYERRFKADSMAHKVAKADSDAVRLDGCMCTCRSTQSSMQVGPAWAHVRVGPAGAWAPKPSALSQFTMDCRVLGGPWRPRGPITWSIHGPGLFVHDLTI